MKSWTLIIGLLIPLLSIGQETDDKMELKVIQETLPQLLDANPNSMASYIQGGAMYEMVVSSFRLSKLVDSTADTNQMRRELDFVADSFATILEKTKILVTLSDTLFAYKYFPSYTEYKDGFIDSTDERIAETWKYTEDDLMEVFQTNHENRGMSNPVDLEFIQLIKAHINNQTPSHRSLTLSELNNRHYEFTNNPPENADSLYMEGLLVHAIRVYRPIFNKARNKACYLYAGQARNGPWREFVFVEKIGEHWILIDEYGSSHIDGNDDWLTIDY